MTADGKTSGTITSMRGHQYLLVLALIALTWSVYFQVLGFDFVNFDDFGHVLENPHVQGGLTWENLRWSVSEPSIKVTANWHPLTWLSYMLDAQFYGTAAGGYHLTNLLLHTANVVLLFLILSSMTNEMWKSAFVAALFAIHPLNAETVAWIAERKGVLSTFFAFLSVWAYVRYAHRNAIVPYLLSLACFVLSLLAKQMMVTLPLLLLLLDYWPMQRIRWNSSSAAALVADRPSESPFASKDWRLILREKIPYLILLVVFCVVALMGQKVGNTVVSLDQLTLSHRISNAIVVYVIYMMMIVWPAHLACYYPQPDTIPALQVVGASLTLIALTIIALMGTRKTRCMLVGWLWFLGTIFPVIGLVQLASKRMADRYTYVPNVGLFVIAAWLVPTLVPAGVWRQRILPCLAAVSLIGYTVAGWKQVATWRNSTTLFEHAVAVTESNNLAYFNLAQSHYALGRYHEAIDAFEASLRIHPDDPVVHDGLGLALIQVGRFKDAIERFRESLRQDPTVAQVNITLGLALYNLYHSGLRDSADAHEPVGRTAAPPMAGNQEWSLLEQAHDQFQQAISKAPGNAEAYFNLGNVLGDLGSIHRDPSRFDQAVSAFASAIELAPHNPAAHNNLGLVLSQLGRYSEAIQHFQQALAVDSADGLTHFNLAKLYLQLGERDLADDHFRMAIQLTPELSQEVENLQRVLKE